MTSYCTEPGGLKLFIFRRNYCLGDLPASLKPQFGDVTVSKKDSILAWSSLRVPSPELSLKP